MPLVFESRPTRRSAQRERPQNETFSIFLKAPDSFHTVWTVFHVPFLEISTRCLYEKTSIPKPRFENSTDPQPGEPFSELKQGCLFCSILLLGLTQLSATEVLKGKIAYILSFLALFRSGRAELA